MDNTNECTQVCLWQSRQATDLSFNYLFSPPLSLHFLRCTSSEFVSIQSKSATAVAGKVSVSEFGVFFEIDSTQRKLIESLCSAEECPCAHTETDTIDVGLRSHLHSLLLH